MTIDEQDDILPCPTLLIAGVIVFVIAGLVAIAYSPIMPFFSPDEFIPGGDAVAETSSDAGDMASKTLAVDD